MKVRCVKLHYRSSICLLSSVYFFLEYIDCTLGILVYNFIARKTRSNRNRLLVTQQHAKQINQWETVFPNFIFTFTRTRLFHRRHLQNDDVSWYSHNININNSSRTSIIIRSHHAECEIIFKQNISHRNSSKLDVVKGRKWILSSHQFIVQMTLQCRRDNP